MPYFQYVGKDDQGRTVEGEHWAQNKPGLEKNLKGLHVVTFEIIGEHTADTSPLSAKPMSQPPTVKMTAPPAAPTETKGFSTLPPAPVPAPVPAPLPAPTPAPVPVLQPSVAKPEAVEPPPEPAKDSVKDGVEAPLDPLAASLLEELKKTALPKTVPNKKLRAWLYFAPALIGLSFILTGLIMSVLQHKH